MPTYSRVTDDDAIVIGKATYEDTFAGEGNPMLASVSPRFAGSAPLWTYVLAESLAG